MKKLIFTSLLICVSVITVFAQVGIGTTTPNASSVLDLTSTNKAFIPPRMTTAQRAAIANPVAGMVVFNTDSTCIEVYRGSSWFNICTGKSSASLPPVDGYTSSSQVAASNLIGYWPFDGSTTEQVHSSAPVLSGGTTAYVAGRIGQAAQLTGGWFTYPTAATGAGANNTGYGSNDTLQNGFTISLWTKHLPDTSLLTTLFQLSFPNTIANWPILGIQYRKHADSTVDFDGGFSNVDAAGPHVSYADANLFQTSAYKDTGTWAFIAMVYDTTGGRNLHYYYNGTLIGTAHTVAEYFVSSATEPLLMLAPNYASIGCAEGQGYTPGSTDPLAGYMSYGINATIDDVRFFNTTLSAQKISDLYQLGNQGR